MRTFKSTTRAAVGLFVAALVTLTLGAFYGFYLGWRQKDTALFTHAEDLIAAIELDEAFERMSATSRGYLLAGDPISLDERARATRDLGEALGSLRAREETPADRHLIDEAEVALRVHREALDRAIAMRGVDDIDAVARVWTETVLPRARFARASLHALVEYERGFHADATERTRSAGERAALIMLAVAGGVLLVAGLGATLLGRNARRTYELEAEGRARAEAAQREADEARIFLGALLDELPIGIIAATPPCRVIHVSASARALLGRELPPTYVVEDLGSWGPVRRRDGGLVPPTERPLARALRGEVVEQMELEDASGRIFATTAAPIRAGDGHVIAAFVAFSDVTDRKRGERERELFLGALGHDLRSPLHAIGLSASGLLKRADGDAEVRRIAGRIASSSERMGRLIQQLLDFTRSQHGAIPIHAARCDLVEIARDAIGNAELASPGREVAIEHDGDVIGYWDADRIAQVLQNLIGNAIEYGAAGTPVVVRIARRADRVQIEVENHGEPIPDDVRPRIFDPFRRGGRGKGLGLGLYIARAIVMAHGGTLDVESQAGATTFRVTLPLDAAAVRAIPAVAAATIQQQPASG